MLGSNAAPVGPASEFLVIDSEPGHFVFGAWKNVFVAVWKAQATGNAVERLASAIESMAAMRPGKRSNVHVIASGAALPTTEARAGFVKLMNRNREALACVAVVIGGVGFWSSALWSAMTALRMLAPRSFDFRLVGTLEELAAWLPAAHESKTGVRIDPEELRAVLRAAPATER
ncbi:MAG TPA: hypothetical protein VE987_13085 [Polyangiaceae bacterium]|nr:hypothetical protein [Polyangiaceae bacterium]